MTTQEMINIRLETSNRFRSDALVMSEGNVDYVFKTLIADNADKQHQIDSLMLEYCPDEMTPEQLENWGKHQVAVQEEV